MIYQTVKCVNCAFWLPILSDGPMTISSLDDYIQVGIGLFGIPLALKPEIFNFIIERGGKVIVHKETGDNALENFGGIKSLVIVTEILDLNEKYELELQLKFGGPKEIIIS